MIDFLIFLVSIVIIARGAVWFSASAVRLSLLLKLPQVVVGATIVSIATTTPETAVAILSSLTGHSSLALGNIIGSPIANFGLILGIVLIFGQPHIDSEILKRNLVFFVIAAIVLLVTILQRTIGAATGVFFLLLSLAYFMIGMGQKWSLDLASREQEVEEIIGEIWHKLTQFLKNLAKLTIGLILILVGGIFLVNSAVNIATILKIPEIIVGLTLVAVGTSLPELSLAIVTIFKKETKISIGNIIGASVLTLTLAFGAATIATPIRIPQSVVIFDLPIILAMILLFFLTVYSRLPNKIVGSLLILTYIFYLAGIQFLE